MKILIVGAGIGGLTLAAFLKDSDIEYEILEKSPDWSNKGYSLGMWNNGRHILNKLGFSEAFDNKSKRIKKYFIYDGKGNLLREYDLKDFYSNYGTAINLVGRDSLHDWLISKVDETKIYMNTSIDSINDDGRKVNVTLTDGQVKEYDLVIGADGIHSKVRELIFKDYVVSKTKWRVWFMWIDNKYKSDSAITEYIASAEFISIFDSGERTLAIIVAKHNNILWDDPKGRIERLKNTFRHETALVPQIFESIKDTEINPNDIVEIDLKSWINKNIVLMGDAAHGFSPFAGIGGSMALEDGYVLAGELMQVSNNYPLSLALKNYEIKRKKRVAIAQRLTSKMKAWALVESKIMRKIINIIVRYLPERYLVDDYNSLLKEEI